MATVTPPTKTVAISHLRLRESSFFHSLTPAAYVYVYVLLCIVIHQPTPLFHFVDLVLTPVASGRRPTLARKYAKLFSSGYTALVLRCKGS